MSKPCALLHPSHKFFSNSVCISQFEMRVPARKFSSYKCIGRAALQAMQEKDSNAVFANDTKEQEVFAEEVEHSA